MRRLLALFMLVLLPLLSSWSAASAYCGDESADRARHLGHHVDKHHGDDRSDSSDGQGAAASDADCDHCHSPGATLASLVNCAQLAVAPELPNRWIDVALRAPPPSLPERPKWARLA